MTKINVVGNFLDSSGYAAHTRNLLNSLMKYAEVKSTCQLYPGQEVLLTDKELIAVKNKSECDINLIITNPINWRMYSTAKRNWAYLVWEGDKIPSSWIDEILNPEIEYIFVPSDHTRKAILNTDPGINHYFEHKIKIVYHGVDLNLFFPNPNKQIEKFTFIVNKGFRNLEDRGGTQYAVKAFLEEFRANEPVEMVVKINPAYGIPNLQEAFKDFKSEDTATVKFITDLVPYNKMQEIYNLGHVFVSATRGEAFNLPCIEAQACGLPVLTTNFGGQEEYIIDGKNGKIIGGELKEVEHELMYEGIKWLTPSIEELRKQMRWFYENKNNLDDMKTNSLNTAKAYSWDKIAEYIVSL